MAVREHLSCSLAMSRVDAEWGWDVGQVSLLAPAAVLPLGYVRV